MRVFGLPPIPNSAEQKNNALKKPWKFKILGTTNYHLPTLNMRAKIYCLRCKQYKITGPLCSKNQARVFHT